MVKIRVESKIDVIGTLYGAGISLRLTNYELHTDYTIRLGESFLGLVDENSISGNFSGEFTGYCIFRKKHFPDCSLCGLPDYQPQSSK